MNTKYSKLINHILYSFTIHNLKFTITEIISFFSHLVQKSRRELPCVWQGYFCVLV